MKEKFNWFAAFFTGLWALYHRLWKVAFIYFIACLVVAIICVAHAALGGYKEQSNTFQYLFIFISFIIFGKYGNLWVRKKKNINYSEKFLNEMGINLFENPPEKIYQPFKENNKLDIFKNYFYGGTVTIDDYCKICGCKNEKIDMGDEYTDKTDIKTVCPCCGYIEHRYIKYDRYSNGPITSYETFSIITDKNLDLLFNINDADYLGVYNILWQDKVIIFELVSKDRKYYFKLNFEEAEKFLSLIIKCSREIDYL